MKILAVMGSPRKGASYEITRQFEHELSKLGEVDFTYLFLKDMNLEMYRGCFSCISKGEEHCPISDDREEIIRRMDEVDGVVFVSPVYYFQVTALMKNFLDRLAYLGHRPRFFGMPAMGIAVCASGSGLKQTLDTLAFTAGFGFNFVHKLGITVHPALEPTAGNKAKADKKISLAAKRFYTEASAKGHKPRHFLFLLSFRALKANAVLAGKCFTADYEYYRDKECYPDTEMNFAKKAMSALFSKLVSGNMKKNYRVWELLPI